MKASLIQTNPGTDRARNLHDAQALVAQAVETDRPDLVVLPEYFEFYGGPAAGRVAAAEPLPGGAAYAAMQEVAKTHRVWVHAGSMIERIPGDTTRAYNTTVVFNRDGREVARYRKIHLFDIIAPDGHPYRESATVKAGDEVVLYDLEGLKVGCTICYDLRFSELFLALARGGADVIVVPAAFTMLTGKDHWEVLLRARAIETQTYVLAAGQCGPYDAGGTVRLTYGHSLVCDPWGHVIARASDGVGFVTARVEPAEIRRVRAQIPMSEHRTTLFATPVP
ncbi:MAG: carbon-nitrogen hydrolase family protein [Vicinamibacterales bacterium]